MRTAAFLLSISLFALSPAYPQQHRELLDPGVRDLLRDSLNGSIAKDHVIQIVKYHRVQASRQYKLAARYVLEQLRNYGFSEKDAYIESYPSDGVRTYQTWQSPSGWDITAAELRMVEPSEERIVGFPDIAMSVMTYSNPGDVTADVVWVGAGTSDADYKGKDVKGKFVLATGYGGDVHRLAVLKYGAKAVVCYLDDDRAKDHPDMVQYTGLWPRAEELKKVTFGFNITNRQGEKLKDLLLAGKKVVLHGWVKGAGLEPDSMQVVVAQIRGMTKPDDEIVFSAHLDHPKESANDNASGSGAILDIARTFRRLIDAKKLPAPQRTFRFLWVPEWYGTMAYLDVHPELKGPDLGGNVLADFNLDMVGENPELLHSRLIITRTPASLPSCVNDVVRNMAQMVDGMNFNVPGGGKSLFNYRIVPYGGGSDHMMFIDRKVPGIMFSHNDYTHHTSEDTPDKVDPLEIERCEMIAAGSAWYLGNLTPAQAMDLMYLLRSTSADRLAELLRAAYAAEQSATVRDLPMRWAEAENSFNQGILQEEAVTKSVLRFASDDRTTYFAGLIRPHLSRHFDYMYGQARETAEANGYASDFPPLLEAHADTLIPERLTRGPLDFRLPESRLRERDASWYGSKEFTLTGDERFELINFIDGHHTVSDIRNLLVAEFGPIDSEVVRHYIRDLVKVGVLKWSK